LACFCKWWLTGPIQSPSAVFRSASAFSCCCWGPRSPLISARQFRQLLKDLDPAVIPPGYWTQVGVALNVIIAVIALAFAVRFLWPNL
jgi:hypothetical protein